MAGALRSRGGDRPLRPRSQLPTVDATGCQRRQEHDAGIREFVVGTGGKSHYALGGPPSNVEKFNDDTSGILRLTLRAGSYDWQFMPVAGKTFTDTGSTTCH